MEFSTFIELYGWYYLSMSIFTTFITGLIFILWIKYNINHDMYSTYDAITVLENKVDSELFMDMNIKNIMFLTFIVWPLVIPIAIIVFSWELLIYYIENIIPSIGRMMNKSHKKKHPDKHI